MLNAFVINQVTRKLNLQHFYPAYDLLKSVSI